MYPETEINRKIILVLRGASGCGKSFLAQHLSSKQGVKTVCADDFFTNSSGEYNFDAAKLNLAHEQCRNRFKEALLSPDIDTIIVANTSTTSKEFSFYKDFAESCGHFVHFLIVENRHGGNNVHNVPMEVLDKQKQRILNDIKL